MSDNNPENYIFVKGDALFTLSIGHQGDNIFIINMSFYSCGCDTSLVPSSSITETCSGSQYASFMALVDLFIRYVKFNRHIFHIDILLYRYFRKISYQVTQWSCYGMSCIVRAGRWPLHVTKRCEIISNRPGTILKTS